MVNIALGAKAKNDDFDISDIDMKALLRQDYDLSLEGRDKRGNQILTLSEDRHNYVELHGSFNLIGMMSGDASKGVKSMNTITVVENGKVSYSVSGLGLTGADLKSVETFADFLASSTYKVSGNVSSNIIVAADNNDAIHGLRGNDKISGMFGNDRLFGDQGADRVTGGEGKDVLSGGSGNDVFLFAIGDGRDKITDFDAVGKAHDRIDLSGYEGIDAFEQLQFRTHKHDVLIDLPGDDMIVLKNVDLDDLDARDFQF